MALALHGLFACFLHGGGVADDLLHLGVALPGAHRRQDGECFFGVDAGAGHGTVDDGVSADAAAVVGDAKIVDRRALL